MSLKNKDKYVFAEYHKKQLASVLGGTSFAFNIDPFNESSIIKIKADETGILTVRKIRVMLSESLLPRHCNPELVEQTLVSLEKNPENTNLLKTLGEYTKNNRFERVGYYGLAAILIITGGTAVAAIFAATTMLIFYNGVVFFTAISIVPFELFFTFNFFSALIYTTIIAHLLFSVLVSDALNTHRLNVLGLKIGKWIGECIKGVSQPANLQELDEKLHQLISEQAKASEHEANAEQAPEVSDKCITYTKTYPFSSLYAINNAGLTVQDTTSNTDDSSQQVPENRFSMT